MKIFETVTKLGSVQEIWTVRFETKLLYSELPDKYVDHTAHVIGRNKIVQNHGKVSLVCFARTQPGMTRRAFYQD